MKTLKLTKLISSLLVVGSVLALNPIGANAEWKQDRTGWWYTEGNSWATGWRVINGNLYYFDSDGYMIDNRCYEFKKEDGLNSNGQFTNVTIHGAWAFCKLTGEIVAYLGSDSNVAIPDKIDNVVVTSIGNEAFFQCKNLTNIAIPNSVKNIKRDAFYGCTNLTSINIPASVKFIETYALSGCSNLTNISVDNNNTNYKSIDGVLYSKEPKVVYYPGGKEVFSRQNGIEILCYPAGKVDKSYTIPSSVASIGSSAFDRCTSLTDITIPDSVTSIGIGVFYECTNLTSINIPNGVTTIEHSTFQNCTNLTNITIPNSITKICNNAFYECESLTSITIPDSVISIEHGAFSGCKNTSFYVKSEAMKQLLIKSGVGINKIILKA